MSSKLAATPSFAVTIRAAGERTEHECFKIVKEQAAQQSSVSIVRKKPIKEALEECFSLGAASQKKWLITVDAYMILLQRDIALLCIEAEHMPEYYLQLQGKTINKLTGTV